MSKPVRTRIAPSPTGFLHLGTARTALYSWAYARHHGGTFVLRIEDTDVARSTPEAVAQIVEAMRWLELDWDEGPYYQMQRLDRYHDAAERLIASGHAYRCWCTPEELDRVVKLTFALRLPVLGPFENMDLIGLDAAERIQKYLFPDLATNAAPSACLSDKVAAGELGMKTGQGFWTWSAERSTQVCGYRAAAVTKTR